MHSYLQRAHDALRTCAGTLTLDQLRAQPPGKWTIAEILEHLARAFSGTTAGAQRTMTTGVVSASPAGPRHRVRAFVVVTCAYLPTGRAAPKSVIPVGIDPAIALATALDNLEKMDAALSEAAARFGERAKLMDHPIIGPLSTRQWRKFHWVHTRHHARQIAARAR